MLTLRRRSRKEIDALITKYLSSTLTENEFIKQNKLHTTRFKLWLKRYNNKSKTIKNTKMKNLSPFIPVKINKPLSNPNIIIEFPDKTRLILDNIDINNSFYTFIKKLRSDTK